MFLAVIMVCSFFAEDDCKFFEDTLGLHMTKESCIERVHEMVESLKGVHRHFEDEIYVLPDSENRFFYKCDDETGIQV